MAEKLHIVQLVNHDYPYWDYAYLTAGAAQSSYPVGQDNVATGAIHKYFTSKDTLIICDANTLIRFNDGRSIQMTLLANVAYRFLSNIYAIYVQRAGQVDTHVYAYFEGVEPIETRSSE